MLSHRNHDIATKTKEWKNHTTRFDLKGLLWPKPFTSRI